MDNEQSYSTSINLTFLGYVKQSMIHGAPVSSTINKRSLIDILILILSIPSHKKRGTIIGLIDRFFLLSHPEFHKKNLEHVIKILLNNDYPLYFIFNTIFKSIKQLVNKNN